MKHISSVLYWDNKTLNRRFRFHMFHFLYFASQLDRSVRFDFLSTTFPNWYIKQMIAFNLTDIILDIYFISYPKWIVNCITRSLLLTCKTTIEKNYYKQMPQYNNKNEMVTSTYSMDLTVSLRVKSAAFKYLTLVLSKSSNMRAAITKKKHKCTHTHVKVWQPISNLWATTYGIEQNRQLTLKSNWTFLRELFVFLVRKIQEGTYEYRNRIKFSKNLSHASIMKKKQLKWFNWFGGLLNVDFFFGYVLFC